MEKPTVELLRKELNLPDTAIFYGWLIYNKEKDDFLHDYKIDDLLIRKYWCLTPDTAKRFKEFDKAYSMIKKLELTDDVVVVGSFDLGKQILISDYRYRL